MPRLHGFSAPSLHYSALRLRLRTNSHLRDSLLLLQDGPQGPHTACIGASPQPNTIRKLNARLCIKRGGAEARRDGAESPVTWLLRAISPLLRASALRLRLRTNSHLRDGLVLLQDGRQGPHTTWCIASA